MKTAFCNCTWAVAHKIDKRTQDDKKTKIRVVATFVYPYEAESFINNCLSAERKANFFVVSTEDLKRCEDADKIQRISELYGINSLYAIDINRMR